MHGFGVWQNWLLMLAPLLVQDTWASNERSESVSRSVMPNSLWPHGLKLIRLFCPWDLPGEDTGVVAISFSRESSRPRDRTRVSWTAGRFFTNWATSGRCKWQSLLKSVFSVNLGWCLPQGDVGISLFLKGIDFLQKSSPHLKRQRRDLLQSWKPQVCLGSYYSLCRTEKIFCLVLHGMARSLT